MEERTHDIKKLAFNFARHSSACLFDFGCMSQGELNLMSGYIAGYKDAVRMCLEMVESPDAFEPDKRLHYENVRYKELIHNLKVILGDL